MYLIQSTRGSVYGQYIWKFRLLCKSMFLYEPFTLASYEFKFCSTMYFANSDTLKNVNYFFHSTLLHCSFNFQSLYSIFIFACQVFVKMLEWNIPLWFGIISFTYQVICFILSIYSRKNILWAPWKLIKEKDADIWKLIDNNKNHVPHYHENH